MIPFQNPAFPFEQLTFKIRPNPLTKILSYYLWTTRAKCCKAAPEHNTTTSINRTGRSVFFSMYALFLQKQTQDRMWLAQAPLWLI